MEPSFDVGTLFSQCEKNLMEELAAYKSFTTALADSRHRTHRCKEIKFPTPILEDTLRGNFRDISDKHLRTQSVSADRRFYVEALDWARRQNKSFGNLLCCKEACRLLRRGQALLSLGQKLEIRFPKLKERGPHELSSDTIS